MPPGLSGSLSSSRRAYYNRPSCKPSLASTSSGERYGNSLIQYSLYIPPSPTLRRPVCGFIINACLSPPSFYPSRHVVCARREGREYRLEGGAAQVWPLMDWNRCSVFWWNRWLSRYWISAVWSGMDRIGWAGFEWWICPGGDDVCVCVCYLIFDSNAKKRREDFFWGIYESTSCIPFIVGDLSMEISIWIFEACEIMHLVENPYSITLRVI